MITIAFRPASYTDWIRDITAYDAAQKQENDLSSTTPYTPPKAVRDPNAMEVDAMQMN